MDYYENRVTVLYNDEYRSDWTYVSTIGNDGCISENGIMYDSSNEIIYSGMWKVEDKGFEEGQGSDRRMYTVEVAIYYPDGSRYFGRICNGRENNIGLSVDSQRNVYRGYFVNGEKTGNGELIYSNGDILKGSDFRNGLLYGEGVLIITNNGQTKGHFVGQFEAGRPKGPGVYYLCSGHKIQGNFDGLERVTNGEIIFENGNTYKGDIVNLVPHGIGILDAKSNGVLYRGYFENGRPKGQGTSVANNGDVYEGEFDGRMHPVDGTLKCASGVTYKGRFEKWLLSGEGRMILKNGDIVEGNFINGKIDRFAKYIFRNSGNTLEGEFDEDIRPCGACILTYSNGNSLEAEFDKNFTVKGIGIYTFKNSGNTLKANFDRNMRPVGKCILTRASDNKDFHGTVDENGHISKFVSIDGRETIEDVDIYFNGPEAELDALLESDRGRSLS